MASNAPTVNMQGVDVPATSVDPKTFYANTRRKRFNEKSISTFAGFGNVDQFTIKQSGIVASVDVHISGQLTVTLGGGTAATTPRWPYDLIKRLILTANGTTNLISCSGAKLAAYRFIANPNLSDRGVTRGIGGASPGTSTTQGTLSFASESWGVGSNVTAIAGGNYDVELYFRIPLAFDFVKLLGAVFGQTQATSLNCEIDWNTTAALFTLTGAATAVFTTCSVVCEGVVFSIPYGPDGNIVIPNLSAFHKLIQYNDYAVGAGLYGSTLVGQGVGQLLQRVLFQLWSGAGAATAPVPLTSVNYGQIGWMYGGDQLPEAFGSNYPAGAGASHMLRLWQEQLYSTDLGALGFGCLDFASHWLARDSVDESTATNLQLMVTPATVTSPVLEVVQETISAGTGALSPSGN
jgi:hypothetical protein